MNFFSFTDNSHSETGTGFPWATPYILNARWTTPPPCDQCRRVVALSLYEGEILLELEGGSKWPDIMGYDGGNSYMIVSERVVDELRDAGIDDFDPQPIVITKIRSKKLRILPEPTYLYINFADFPAGIDIDLDASGIPDNGVCPACGVLLPAKTGRPFLPHLLDRVIPLPETWNGSHIFRGRNFSVGRLLCSERLIELAREHRWTNFRFEPIDIKRDDSTRWAGVDYLGKKWPPQWYPEPASAGKTLEAWIDDYASADAELNHKAYQALVENDRQAVPHLARLLGHARINVRLRTARTLLHWHQYRGVDLPDEFQRRAALTFAEVLKEERAEVSDQPFEAHSLLLFHKAGIPFPEDILDKARHLAHTRYPDP